MKDISPNKISRRNILKTSGALAGGLTGMSLTGQVQAKNSSESSSPATEVLVDNEDERIVRVSGDALSDKEADDQFVRIDKEKNIFQVLDDTPTASISAFSDGKARIAAAPRDEWTKTVEAWEPFLKKLGNGRWFAGVKFRLTKTANQILRTALEAIIFTAISFIPVLGQVGQGLALIGSTGGMMVTTARREYTISVLDLVTATVYRHEWRFEPAWNETVANSTVVTKPKLGKWRNSY